MDRPTALDLHRPSLAAPAAPLTFGERAAILRGRGWTPRQAEWLTLVCLHSGVFTRSQDQAHYGVTAAPAIRFVRALPTPASSGSAAP